MIYSNLSREDLACWWALSTRCGPAAKLPFLLWKQSSGVWSAIDRAELNLAHTQILDALKPEKAKQDFLKLTTSLQEGVHILAMDSPLYPKSLWDLKTPPLFLFVKGELDLLKSFGSAVVGTRQPDREALRLTHMVVQRKVVSSHTIISGGAIGIDTQVHQSAIDEGGRTIAVLPSGIHAPSPRSNIALFRDVVDRGGAIVSEYSPFSTPRKFHFHRRNALLAALSEELIVVRARKKSGTLISAKAASDLGRPLFAIPGSPLDPLSEGPNFLIASGEARMFDFARAAKAPRLKARSSPLEGSEARVYKHLNLSKNVDELTSSIPDMSANEILSALTLLEIGGYIEADKKRGGYRRT